MKTAVAGIIGTTIIWSLTVNVAYSQPNISDTSVTLLMSKATTFLNDNLLDSALAYCNLAIAAQGTNGKLLDFRGVVYTKMQKYSKAVRDFKAAITLDSACYEAYNHLGIVYMCRNELDLAIECFNRSVELNPAYAKAYYNRGIARLYQQDTNEALDDMKKAAELKHSEAIKFLHQIN
ncbi:MAG: tetratricopeptide repeat protein [Bacteroidales bacterium]